MRPNFSILATLLLTISAFVVFGTSQTAQASQPSGGPFGLGFGSGTMSTGLSLKYHTGGALAYQGNVGFLGGWRSCDDGRYCRRAYDAIGLSGDILLEQPAIVQADGFNLAWNVGGGAGLALWDDGVNVAGAFILGLEFNLEVIPIDLVVEYRPRLFVVDFVGFDVVNFTGHIRFYF